jgi:hypothetical protein
VPEIPQNLNETNTNRDLGCSILAIAITYSISMSTSSTNNNCTTVHSTEDFDCSWPQHRGQLNLYCPPQTHRHRDPGRCFDSTPGAQLDEGYLHLVFKALGGSIPPSIDTTQMIREGYSVQIILGCKQVHIFVINSHRCRALDRLKRFGNWFMTPPAPVRDPLLGRMKRSKITMWTIYLGAQIFRAFGQDPSGSLARGYIGWVDKFENKFDAGSCRNPSPDDISDHLFTQLEVFNSFICRLVC